VCLRKSHIADGFFMESDAQHLKLFWWQSVGVYKNVRKVKNQHGLLVFGFDFVGDQEIF
jgi:hypothetical protein